MVSSRRSILRGPELWRLLKERLKDPNRPAFQSTWQDVDLVWRVLRALMARLDLGGMGPLVVQALDPQRMTLVKKDVSEYVGDRYAALRAVDSPPRVPDVGTAEGRDGGGVL